MIWRSSRSSSTPSTPARKPATPMPASAFSPTRATSRRSTSTTSSPAATRAAGSTAAAMPRYAEQFWDTFFAKVPEIMLFNSQQIMGRPAGRQSRRQSGRRPASWPISWRPSRSPTARPTHPTWSPAPPAIPPNCSTASSANSASPSASPPTSPATPSARRIFPTTWAWSASPSTWFPTSRPMPRPFCSRPRRVTTKTSSPRPRSSCRPAAGPSPPPGLIEALGDKGFQDIAEIEVTGHRVIAKRFGRRRGGGRRRAAGASAEAGPEHPAAANAPLRKRHLDVHQLHHRRLRLSDGSSRPSTAGARSTPWPSPMILPISTACPGASSIRSAPFWAATCSSASTPPTTSASLPTTTARSSCRISNRSL